MSEEEKGKGFHGEWRHHHHEGSFVGGIVLIVVGLVFLLNALGFVSWDIWNHIWQFWPVILIIWGIRAILGNNYISQFLVGLLVLVVLGLIVLFGVTKVNPEYKKTLPPQINSVLNQMNMLGVKQKSI